jgi:uncharacterized damage-inducible protein DinB
MPRMTATELTNAYLSSVVQLRRLVSDMTEHQLRARPIPGKWSTLEVIAHLVDSDQAWCHRIKRVIAEERPFWIGYDQTRFTTALDYHSQDRDELLGLLAAMRQQMARTLCGLPEPAWSRTGVHSEWGLLTLEEMVLEEIEHIPHHIKHIMEKRQVLGLPIND